MDFYSYISAGQLIHIEHVSMGIHHMCTVWREEQWPFNKWLCNIVVYVPSTYAEPI